MKKIHKNDHVLLRYGFALLLLMVFAMAVHSSSSGRQLAMLLLAAAGIWVIACSRVALRFSALAITAAVAVLLLFCCAIPAHWIEKREGVRFRDLDGAPQESYFQDRSVMLIVPHQDDDACLLGGVIERFARHGRIRVVFTTNGDYHGTDSGQLRIRQAVSALTACGVPEEDILFLGYGDGNDASGGHIYLHAGDEPITSNAGMTQTYATEAHPPFRTHAYTRDNFKSDIRDVILMYRPDTIFCVDQDAHMDHRAASMLVEEVLGELLAESDAYQPLLYKGYAYFAWYAGASEAENLISTQYDAQAAENIKSFLYDWDDRFRLPISSASATRLQTKNIIWKMLQCYGSQAAVEHYGSVLRGDKVFWRRNTDAVRMGVMASAASGDAARLIDFKLIDERKAQEDRGKFSLDGVWSPEADGDRTAHIAFSEPRSIERIVLYDNLLPADNVLEAEIAFSDGTRLLTGALRPNGAATEIAFPARRVDGFSVTLLETEGESAGLMEVEAYQGESPLDRPLVKLMDENGNFSYHYQMGADATAAFTLFEQNVTAHSPVASRYTLSLSGVRGDATAYMDEAGVIHVSCPDNARCVLRIQNKDDAALWDEIAINDAFQPWQEKLYEWSKPLMHAGFFQRQIAHYGELLKNGLHFVQRALGAEA